MGEGMDDPQDKPIDTYAYLATQLGTLGLSYIHVVEAFRDTARNEQSEPVYAAIRTAFRDAGGHAYVANGEYSASDAAQRIANDNADAIAFGKPFISNPDLAERFRRGAPLNEWDQSTFYGGGAEGYTTYPSLG
jgi:N-ethylmaleimide reductase